MMPRMRMLWLVALAGIPLVVGLVIPSMGSLGIALTMLLFASAAVDLVISATPARVEVRREASKTLSVGTQNAVTVWLRNRNRIPVTVEVHDHPPAPCGMSDLPFTIDLQPDRNRYFVYHVEPHQRGKNQFGPIDLRCRSRLGLWTLCDQRNLDQPVRIYPDIKAIHGVELLARQNRLAEAGVKMSRLRSRGREFDRLREYRREDEYHSIDWKATARMQSLVSREYVVERNQNVLFLLDCGRSMCNAHAGVTHFDRALNAVILLSYVALRQGDTVGLLAFSNRMEQWVPPVRGTKSIQSLIRQTYELQPVYEASDYDLMIEQLRNRYRKRSLVILVSHALDEVHFQLMSRYARLLRSPHLGLLALLRNVPLDERAGAIPQSDLDAFQIAAATDIVASQKRQAARLEQSGLLVVDSLPEELSAQLISRYLDIKARHLL